MNSNEIRKRFLEFFNRQGHAIVPSSSLIPGDDPSLLFTNAGMVQFKDLFLGLEQRDYRRAVSSQRCVRAGGKHNDLENVGYTARHHTFFEMLGNFSFGDYFKREAITWAWELLTQEFALPPERLWITVHESDNEAEAIWLQKIGVDPARFSRCGDDSNFWTMGNTGPCGPCTEIFYDHGPHIAGGPPGSPDADGDRYVEIWNLVFTQYDRDEAGTLNPIPKPSVDTGMGLERVAAVLQGVHSNYDIDLFRNLMGAVYELVGSERIDRQSVQVIADHIRSCAFLVADGVIPSNEGRGYVLRRIIRRALRHGHKLGLHEPFFFRLVATLQREMGVAYPLLTERQADIEQILRGEEEKFRDTLAQGLVLLEESLAAVQGKEIPGEVVFRLYDTYGFPVDLTADIARERGLGVDHAGFEAAMQQQRERARAASRFSGIDTSEAIHADRLAQLAAQSRFTGYDGTSGAGQVLALFQHGQEIAELESDAPAVLILDATPFYAASGGQVGDRGVIKGTALEFEVTDTQQQGGVHLHFGRMTHGRIRCGDGVTATVEGPRRAAIRRNHSATHLLHAALRAVLGKHVTQKGSLVEPERLRFDFAHTAPVTRAELETIEVLVNERIRDDIEVESRTMGQQEAIAAGALALFGEKYGEQVRVLRMGTFSTELCGGTHVSRSGEIGLFKIVSESGIAAGVRRIEALTGAAALAYVVALENQRRSLAERLKTSPEDLDSRIDQALTRLRDQEKEIERLRAQLARGASGDLAAQAVEVAAGIKVIASVIDGADAAALRTSVDRLKEQLGTGIVVLAAIDGGTVRLVAGVTKNLTGRVSAGVLVNFVAGQVGGKGGGRADLAQAGGDNPARLGEALAAVPDWIREQLADP
ncbi:MAG: alanine--tRNA ligase [Gammaproteobacteria bacterium]|nr:alanine--tRNA ligase [Gammaproteobacteria bacterium]